MGDEKQLRCPTRYDEINLADGWEIKYWTKQFGCSEHDLRNAIQVVGYAPNKVLQQLNRYRSNDTAQGG